MPGEPAASSRRATAFVLLGAAALGSLALPAVRELRPSRETRRVFDRWLPLARALPPDVDEVGFVTDEPNVVLQGALIYQARYALAPRVVREGAGKRFTVAFLADPAKLDALARRAGQRPVTVLAGGACLLERDGR